MLCSRFRAESRLREINPCHGRPTPVIIETDENRGKHFFDTGGSKVWKYG
jgi:hypothetical protein